MSLALYTDESVHGDISAGLLRRSVDVLTIQQDQRLGSADPDVLDRATELGRLLFSQDQDHLREAALRQEQGIHFAGVVYAHKEYISIREAIEELEIIAKLGSPEDFADRITYIPWR